MAGTQELPRTGIPTSAISRGANCPSALLGSSDMATMKKAHRRAACVCVRVVPGVKVKVNGCACARVWCLACTRELVN